MNKKTEVPRVLYTDDKAATFRTDIKGWVDRHGRYFGNDLHVARWSGCTHIVCKGCGKPTEKNYLTCEDCREKADIERFKKRKVSVWNGTIPVYSECLDKYFMEADELSDFLEEYEGSVESLRLLICEPVYPRPLESDYFSDCLSEDEDAPKALLDAIDRFNLELKEIGSTSWTPGDNAVDCIAPWE